MFKKMELLDKNKHADLKLKPVEGYNFASGINYTFLAGSEVAKAARTFPVVFPVLSDKNEPLLPLALLSLTPGGNSFVDDKGRWTADYLPVHLRRYPFILGAVPESKGEFAIMIDGDSSRFSKDEGTPLFNEKGEPEEIISKVQSYLGKYQKDILKTQKVLKQLEEAGVLVEKQFQITLGEKKKALKGFRVVDMEKVMKLDNDTLGKWVKNGLMSLVFNHAQSFDNLKKLALAEEKTLKS